MNSGDRTWRIRPTGSSFNPTTEYGMYNSRFMSIRLVHGGSFTPFGSRKYNDPRVTFVDFIDGHLMSKQTFQEIINELGYEEPGYFYWQKPSEDLDFGLCKIDTPTDVQALYSHVYTNHFGVTPQVFCETGMSTVNEFYPESLMRAPPKKISKMLFKFVFQNPYANHHHCSNFLYGQHGITLPEDLVKAAFWLANNDVREVKAGFKIIN